ncbi:MAG: DUF418 domain-containing protein [Candidatus Poseidonia sp.]|nr:DUF418 domain-containing protein [Poseidonia sp.]
MEQQSTGEVLPSSQRITHLDTVRGVAVMGILIMNAISFFFVGVAYFDISSPENKTILDWLVGGFGEVFADQKFMALFSILFGASVLLFCERAAAKGHSPVRLSLWRNFLLLLMGLFHESIWEGDILFVYACCAPVLLLCRKLPPTLLISVGTLLYLSPIIVSGLAVSVVDPAAFLEVWGSLSIKNPSSDVDLVLLGLMYDVFARAMGMMFIGMGLYANGMLIHANASDALFKRSLCLVALGALLSGVGLAWTATQNFSPTAIVQGNFANTVGTVPLALGYLGLLMWWNEKTSGVLINRIRALGKTALTNYIGQTVVCVVLASLLPNEWLSRTTVFLLIIVIWWAQLYLAEKWLKRYRFGPLEYLWRCATYRRLAAFVNKERT